MDFEGIVLHSIKEERLKAGINKALIPGRIVRLR